MKIVVEFTFPDSDIEAHKLLLNSISKIEGVETNVLSSFPSGEVTFDVIEKLVCEYTKISVQELQLSKRLKREVVVSRQLCHHIAMNLHLGTLEKIGQRFGNKDHATCLYSNRTVLGLLQTNVEFRNQFKSFIDSFNERHLKRA